MAREGLRIVGGLWQFQGTRTHRHPKSVNHYLDSFAVTKLPHLANYLKKQIGNLASDLRGDRRQGYGEESMWLLRVGSDTYVLQAPTHVGECSRQIAGKHYRYRSSRMIDSAGEVIRRVAKQDLRIRRVSQCVFSRTTGPWRVASA